MIIIDKFEREYRFLSNFFPSTLVYKGWEFKTVEHAFQACKMISVDNARRIQLCTGPGDAKRLARKLPMRPDWDDIKEDVMRDCLEAKFSDPILKKKLLDTGNASLIEGNTWGDYYWGCCNGEGQNRLGSLLMELREKLLCSVL